MGAGTNRKWVQVVGGGHYRGGMAGLTVAVALKNLGMNEKEILDIIHAASIFGWANRLMLNLGEPVFP